MQRRLSLARKSRYYKQFIAGNNNNQAGRDINNNNFLAALKIKPRSVRVQVIRSYFLYYVLFALAIAMMMFILLTFICYYFDNNFFEKENTVLMVILASSTIVGTISSIVFFEKVFRKVKWGYVLYKNKTIVYGLKREKFYDDIWDMELKKTWIGHGRLRYFGITKGTDKPYSRVITLMNYAEAKYIYDSFWSHNN